MNESALDVDTTIAHYRILSRLGAGGMGEVWLAEDTRLHRKVALKLLPAEFARDAERLRRFEQEAQAASALNHPNILTIYDIGTSPPEFGGAPYIVTELLEGDELRALLNGSALTTRQTIDYAQQIASGLSATHAKGIVHRDLKPENLFVTTEGRVKILDFGLARMKPPKLAGKVDSEAPTQRPPERLTDPGVILGTVGYMSPEQVRGQEADPRADIFAFGVILYEMLSGRRTFSGESVVEVLNAILKEEPPELGVTNAKISPQLEKIVRRCLEKKPERRFQSASDLGFALETLTTPSGAQLSGAPIGTLPAKTNWLSREKLLLAAMAFAVLTALFFAWTYFTRKPVADNQTIRLAIPLPEKAGNVLPISISPDGQYVAFHAPDAKGVPMLWLRPLNVAEAKPIAGSEGASNMHFWSPDSRYIATQIVNKVKKVAISGGTPQTISDYNMAQYYGGTWNKDGVILLGTGGRGLIRASENGGEATELMRDKSRQETWHRFPQFLPDGQHFLYRIGGQPAHAGIYVGSLDGQLKKRILDGESNAIYAPPGYLVFVRASALMAQRFDAERFQVTGEPFRLAEQVGNLNYRDTFAASANGFLVFDPSLSRENQRLAWMDRNGKVSAPPGPVGRFYAVELSPDEKKAAATLTEIVSGGKRQIRLIDLSQGTDTRFTFGQYDDIYPVWSPDGRRIVWRSFRDGVSYLYQKVSSGAGPEEMLLKGPAFPFDWSADGRFIICDYTDTDKGGVNGELWAFPMSAGLQPFPAVQTNGNARRGRLSPDGKWIAYTSNESGDYEIYVRSFPDTGGKWQVSTKGGTEARWRRNGKELFYVSADRKLMAVDVKTGATFETGTSHALFDLPTGWEAFTSNYAVTKDGQRFLLPVGVEVGNTAPLAVVVNWTELLKW